MDLEMTGLDHTSDVIVEIATIVTDDELERIRGRFGLQTMCEGGGQANVVDQAGLEALAKAANGGPIKRADGKEVKSVVFVQCAGQRDTSGEHLNYCSGHCCATSIKQATYFKDANPDVDTTVLYTDLRMPGNNEDFYRSAQNKGVTFSKGKVKSVEANGNQCKVQFHDLILNDENAAIADADLVVLATGLGKTWLAVQWCHQHLDQFPDGQLFVDLRGFSPTEEQMTAAGEGLCENIADEIDSIRTFDPDSQRSLYPVNEVRLLPGREFPMDDPARARFRARWRELLEGDPTKSRIYKDMGNGVATAGIEYYLPLFFDDTATVFDYLGEAATLVLHG